MLRPPSRTGMGRFKASASIVDDNTALGLDRGPGLIPNAQQLLRLMQQSHGSIRGDLVFKKESSTSWLSGPCYIEAATNGLWCEVDGGQGKVSIADSLIADLRGCSVYISIGDADESAALRLRTSRGDRLTIVPRNILTISSWFAALLCWQPSRLELTAMRDVPPWKSRSFGTFLDTSSAIQISADVEQEHTVVKIDRAVMLDELDSQANGSASSISKDNVSCVLRDNGQLTIQAARGATIFVSISLDQVPRAAIQRVKNGVFGISRVIAIYPQYATSSTATSRLRPIYLSYEQAELHEVWFVLLRAFADAPLTPSSRKAANDNATEVSVEREWKTPSKFLRIEQSLEIRVDAIHMDESARSDSHISSESKTNKQNSRRSVIPSSIYVEILLDEQVRARTAMKAKTNESPHWYETYTFSDLGAQTPCITIKLREQEIRLQSPRLNKRTSRNLEDIFSAQLRLQPSDSDAVLGTMSIGTKGKPEFESSDSAWKLVEENGAAFGEVVLKIRHKKERILALNEYDRMFRLLQDIENDLSPELYSKMQSNVAKVAEVLLTIFEAGSQAQDWLQYLVDREVLGASKLAEPAEHTGASSDGTKNAPATEQSSAFLLFRGNTLLSRAVDAYMKLKGNEYLDQTIGNKLREIHDMDLDCEVDPSRLDSPSNVKENWHNLKSTTEEIWSLIYHSASFCPAELRMVFHYIRTVAEEKFGSMNTTSYTSVSGFLFLRFFCAAVLNPQLFGLINSAPGPRAQRTFMLVAKALQGLANLTSYGYKESWMSPMNKFCSSHTRQFKEFIDMVCIVSAHDINSQEGGLTSYSVATLESVFHKLSPAAREGLPSLPSLRDPARSLASLVDLWLEDVENDGNKIDLTDADTVHGALPVFHSECLRLHRKTQKLAKELDPSPRGSDSLSTKWVSVAERLETHPREFWGYAGTDRKSPSARRPRSPTGASVERHGSRSGSSAKASGDKRDKRRERKASPTREDASNNALRKLGWI